MARAAFARGPASSSCCWWRRFATAAAASGSGRASGIAAVGAPSPKQQRKPPPLPQWAFLSWCFYGGVGACGFINDLFFAICSCGRPRAFEPPLLLGDPAVLDGTSASGSGSGAAAAPTPAPKAYLATPASTCARIPVCDNISDNRLGRVQRCRTHRACLRTAGSVAFTLLSLQYRYSLSKK